VQNHAHAEQTQKMRIFKWFALLWSAKHSKGRMHVKTAVQLCQLRCTIGRMFAQGNNSELSVNNKKTSHETRQSKAKHAKHATEGSVVERNPPLCGVHDPQLGAKTAIKLPFW
jgi:hypothetical protein